MRTRGWALTRSPAVATCLGLCSGEDQNLWIDARGNFHTLMHAYRGQPCDYPVCDRVKNKQFCTAVGGHAFVRAIRWVREKKSGETTSVFV